MKLDGKKTYIVSIGAVLSAIGAFLSGNAELADSLQIIITSILAATLRHGVSK